MSTEKKYEVVRKRQEDIDAKVGENEVEETLDSVSYKYVKDSKKENNQIGDSDRE
jgi:hypothetical protein